MAKMHVLLACGLLGVGGPVAAETWTLAGHSVALEDAEAGGSVLTVDGAQVLEDGLILPDGAHNVPGGAVFFGVSGPGGNACDAAPFALWLPEGGAARLDGPIETCAYLQADFTGTTVVWTSETIVGRMTEQWIWTPEGGILAEPSTPFAPDAGRGWDNILGLDSQHPADALRLEPVYDTLVAGLGDQFQTFAERISEMGSGGLIGKDYFGQACIQEVCDTDFAGIWLDNASQQVFVFWRSYDDAAVSIYPQDRGLWPAGALAKLAEAGG